MTLWTMGKSLGIYPHGKRGKHGFSTRLFTLSTVMHREICGQKENKCLFCGNLKMPKIRHSSFWEKMSCLDKLSYGNRFLKISQTFLWVLTAKKVWKFIKFLKKKKGIWKKMENIKSKQVKDIWKWMKDIWWIWILPTSSVWYIFRSSFAQWEDHEGSCFYALQHYW